MQLTPAQTLIALVVGVVMLWVLSRIFREYRRRRAEEYLRRHPPKRTTIEVRLPRDVADAPQRMQGFLRRVQAALPTDSKARRRGRGEIHMVWHAEVPENALQPTLRFMVTCDEDQMNLVKRLLKQSFDLQAEIRPVEMDPLVELAEQAEATRRLDDPHAE